MSLVPISDAAGAAEDAPLFPKNWWARKFEPVPVPPFDVERTPVSELVEIFPLDRVMPESTRSIIPAPAFEIETRSP